MKRFLRCVLLCTSLLDTITTVSCQSRVQTAVGDSALLPCVYQKSLSKPPAVYWKDNNNTAVLDIRDNKATKKEKFRQRVESFPDVFEQGNFSIVVRDVQLEDGGLYDCFIPSLDFQHRVSLTVADKPEQMGAEPLPRGSSTVNSLHMALLLPLLLALLLLLSFTSC